MERHKEIFDLFQGNQLPPITPMWHIKKVGIDLSKQPQKLRTDLLSEGYTIIENVNFEMLLDKMDSADANIFRDKKLYRSNFTEHGISEVIGHWLNNTKLIPPSILVRDSIVHRNCPDTMELMPSDGKHRMNVAYFFGATEIPIFVINKQLKKVKAILGIE